MVSKDLKEIAETLRSLKESAGFFDRGLAFSLDYLAGRIEDNARVAQVMERSFTAPAVALADPEKVVPFEAKPKPKTVKVPIQGPGGGGDVA
ncbi:MAG: hypothetical protein ACPGOV_11720 [Magnetovibrionaceae bacterium]